MPCERWNDEWVAHLYGELDPSQERALEAHLDGCDACRATLEELEASRELLREAAPEVPAAPRVVVLRPRPVASTAWAFAGGAALALLLFGAGFFAGPRLTGNSGPLTAQELAPAGDAQPTSGDTEMPRQDELARSIRDDLQAFEQRLAQLEQRPGPESMSQAELQQALDLLERRVNRERAQDLEYVLRSITASELRTGTWIDQAEEALTMLALRQDPRFEER